MLIDHYLFAALQLHEYNLLRQVEIIKEIKVILLSETSQNPPIRKKHNVEADL